jgi:hypothetical protein
VLSRMNKPGRNFDTLVPKVTPAGFEPAIFCSEDRRLIH